MKSPPESAAPPAVRRRKWGGVALVTFCSVVSTTPGEANVAAPPLEYQSGPSSSNCRTIAGDGETGTRPIGIDCAVVRLIATERHIRHVQGVAEKMGIKILRVIVFGRDDAADIAEREAVTRPQSVQGSLKESPTCHETDDSHRT